MLATYIIASTMNIAFFVDTYFPQLNGVATVVHQLKDNLETLGHSVYVLTPRRHNSPEANGVYYLKARPSKIATNEYIATENYKNVVNFCIEHNIDILHAHSEFSVALIAIKVAKEIKKPFLITFHTFWEHYISAYIPCSFLIPKKIVHTWIKHVYKNADVIYAVSQKVFDYLSSPKILPQKKILLIENAVDNFGLHIRDYSKTEIQNLKNDLSLKDEKVFLYVGRVSHEKRIKQLLHIFKSVLQKTHQALRLIIIGDGPAKDYLVKYANKLGINKEVSFVGFVQRENLGLFFSISDLFVSASISETYSMTVTEALCFYVPCILRDDECYYDRIKHAENGLMLKNDAEFAEALTTLVVNNEELLALKEKTKQSFTQLSSMDQTKKYLESYTDVLQEYL